MEADVRRVARLVVALNLGAFCVEIAVASTIGSISLFADSVDFLEDASINILILVGLAWTSRARARLGMGLAAILLAPGLATLAMAWLRWSNGTPPDPVALGLTGVFAFVVNAICAWLLMSQRASGGSVMKAAFLSARNDTLANAAVIGSGVATALTHSVWPDLGVGIAIAALNAGAAFEVWEAARDEHRAAAK